MRVLVAEIVQEPGLCRRARISGVDAVYVGPNHEFIRIHDVSNDGAGKIGAVAPERGDAPIRGRSDEPSDYRNDGIGKQWQQNFAATLPGLLEMRLGILKCIASQDKFGGGNRNRRYSGTLQRGGKEAHAESLTKGCEPINKFCSGRRG